MNRYQQQYRAFSSEIVITIVTDKSKAYVDCIFGLLHSRISKFEKQFSRFLLDSELTQFNLRAGNKTLVSTLFLKLLNKSKELSEETNGIYNPFVLPALQQVGYIGSWPKMQDKIIGIDFTNRQMVTFDNLVIGDTWAQIPKNTALDFGGIGKGFILDELSERLDEETLNGYWLSLGGDIICNGYDVKGEDWQVAIQHAIYPSKKTGLISNLHGGKIAIATSGVLKRQGIKNDKRWHHIIDPRTKQPAKTDLLTATVTANSGVSADIYAKCIIVTGVDQAEKYKNSGAILYFLVQ